jgi:hypothetical protein
VAIAFRSFGTVKKGTTGNLASVVLPTGHATNDILVLKLIGADNATGSMGVGWTQKLAVNNGTHCRYEEWWKRDNGAESAPTVTRTGTKVASICWIEAYSGVDSGLADPYRDAQTQTGTGTAAGNFTITCPALTGVVSGDFRLAFVGFGAAVTDGAPIFGTISGWTENVTDQVQGAGVDEAAGASNNLAATGSAGSVTSTASWNGANAPSWVGAQSALSSATSGGAVTILQLAALGVG